MHYFMVTIILSLIYVFEISSAVLPEQAESSNLTGQKKRILTKEEALDFVRKVKAKFVAENGGNKYKKFHKILTEFKKQGIDRPEVHHEMHELFKDNEDLLGEFLKFMPEEYHKNGNETAKRRKIEMKKEKGIKIETNSAAGSNGDDDDVENGDQEIKNFAKENGQKLKQPKNA
ncbi:hypothetical protein niasHS_013727 [Heterodera schachtii]|uniref:Uncharacterized protein n=1 Tax=Heterodera schachtii TaxID=97005 RepID=A0ABD2IM59_HETSC